MQNDWRYSVFTVSEFFDWHGLTQPTFTFSKSTIEIVEQVENCLKLTIKTPNFEQFSHNRPYNFGTFYGNFSQSSIKYLSKCRLKYFQLFCYCQVRNLEGQAISSLKNYMTHINLGSKYPTNSCLFFFFLINNFFIFSLKNLNNYND